MKKRIVTLLLALLLTTAVGCSKVSENSPSQNDAPSVSSSAPDSITTSDENSSPSSEPDPASESTDAPPVSTAPLAPSSEEPINLGSETVEALVVQVSDGTHTITFQLNDSKAAKGLYNQLPLSLDVQDYSNNEKIFYPPSPLDVSDAPKADGSIGTLAYYAPWADVVLFFGSYSPNSSLYGLGQVTSGSDQIQLLSGTITITAIP